MGRWGDGKSYKYLVIAEDRTFFYTELSGFDIIVKVGRITSSPSPIPKAPIATSIAIQPLQTAIAYFLPTRLAKACSNCLTKVPSEGFSLPFTKGSFTGRNSVILMFIFTQNINNFFSRVCIFRSSNYPLEKHTADSILVRYTHSGQNVHTVDI